MHRARMAAEEEINRSSGAESVEIRVHGMGDHTDWSPLGSAALLPQRGPGKADVALPPRPVRHALRLVNWSRTNRRVASGIWYAAVPFTLVNVAHYMMPSAPGWRRSVQQACVVVVGLLLTLSLYVWSVALAETVLRVTFLPFSFQPYSGQVAAALIGVLLVRVVLGRRRGVGRTEVPAWMTALHVVVLLAATVAALFKPTQWNRELEDNPTVAASILSRMFFVSGPSQDWRACTWDHGEVVCQTLDVTVQEVLLFDVVTATALVTVAFAGLASLFLTLVGWKAARSEPASADPRLPVEGGAAMSAVGLCLFLAAVLFHAVASAVRLFTDHLVGYIARHDIFLWTDAAAVDRFSGKDSGIGSAPFRSRVMLPYQMSSGDRDDAAMDLIPLLGITAVVALVAAVILVNRSPRGVGRPLFGRRSAECATQRARWSHNLITGLGVSLHRILAAGSLFWLVLNLLVMMLVFPEGGYLGWRWAVVSVQVIAVVVAMLLLAARRFETTRVAFGSVADILGFWPVSRHPLAGDSYRDGVVDSIRQEIAERPGSVVLVGHSQGSVLAAWAIGGPDVEKVPWAPRDRLVLVTCGSPLVSLYATFFPAHVNAQFFDRTLQRVRRWANFWRDTDPIATAFGPALANPDEPPPASLVDVRLDDPVEGGWPQAHGDYWIAPEQEALIDAEVSSVAGARAAADRPVGV